MVTSWRLFALSFVMLAIPSRYAGGQTPSHPELSFASDDAVLEYPLPEADAKYGLIEGARLKQYVEEQAAIARRYRDRGDQYWGRIMGLESDAETAEWMAARLRAAGASNVRIQRIDLPPQWIPRSWEVRI